MAQDDPKGQPSSGRGKGGAPTASNTTDTHNLTAAPLPATPVHDPAGGDSAAPAATPPAANAAASGETKPPDGGGTGGGGETETQRLLREIADAKRALDAKQAEFDIAEKKRKEQEATTKLVEDYSKEVSDLRATREGLRQYQLAETSFLNRFLDATAMHNIANASAGPAKEIADLKAKIDADTQAATAEKAKLDSAKQHAADAKAKAEALKRPAASIRDSLKAADAVRAEAKKASDAGNYALAYWLIMDGGRLDDLLNKGPQIIAPADLAAATAQSAAEQSKAEAELNALLGRIKALDAGIQADTAQLAALIAKQDSKVRESLAQFNPKSAAAA
jgi:hypothetical protein